ncbi:MAG: NosD domain-containing protein, partial [Candidatus Thorarchaeota archaeon]
MKKGATTAILALLIVVSISLPLIPNKWNKRQERSSIIDQSSSPSPIILESTHTTRLLPIGEYDNPSSAPSSTQNYTEHANIEITSNADFSAQKIAENWTGDGSEGNPFVIQGYNITFRGQNIYISNVTAHFEIRNCLLISPSSMPHVGAYDNGIAIENSTNGAVLFNEILGGRDAGVYIGYSNITIVSNQFSQYDYIPSYRGIIFASSSGSVLYNGIRDSEVDGIWITNSSQIEVASNVIEGGTMGISVMHSNNVGVTNNVLIEGAGIWLYNIGGSIISRNVVSDSFGSSITVSNALFTSIYQNVIVYGDSDGILVDNSTDCSFTGNQIIQCLNGIMVYSSFSSTFSYNYIVGNSGTGLHIGYGFGNSIYGNLF